jgi:hypothetical protein
VSKHPLLIELFCGLGAVSKVFEEEGWMCVGFDIERHIYGPERYPCQLVLQDVLTLHGRQFRDADFIWASPPCQEFSYMAMPWKRGKEIADALRGEGKGFPAGYTGSRTVQDLRALFDSCFRIQREASIAAGHHIPMVVENVKGAQPWVGQARANFGSFFLWGDIGMANGNIVVPGAEFGDVLRAPSVAGHREGTRKQPVWFNDDKRDAAKCGGDWFGSGKDCSLMRNMSSGSSARKAASAMIAKIPEPLSRYLARAFNPGMVIARGGIATRGGH